MASYVRCACCHNARHVVVSRRDDRLIFRCLTCLVTINEQGCEVFVQLDPDEQRAWETHRAKY